MDKIVDDQLKALESEISKKDEYIEQCYICEGFMLRKHAYTKRIASDSGFIITSDTEQADAKTHVEIKAGELREVFLCRDCEEELIKGRTIRIGP